MFAVIKTGGKQYKVAAENKITVMSLEGEAGSTVTFDDVLALFDGETNQLGAPDVAGATVVGEIVEQTRGAKVIAFKKRRRKNSNRKHGHKQDLTIVKITQILPQGRAGRLRRITRAPRLSLSPQLHYSTRTAALRAPRRFWSGLTMAHKKAGGSSRNGRDSDGRRLGVKKFGGEKVLRATLSCASAARSSTPAAMSAWAPTIRSSPPPPAQWRSNERRRVNTYRWSRKKRPNNGGGRRDPRRGDKPPRTVSSRPRERKAEKRLPESPVSRKACEGDTGAAYLLRRFGAVGRPLAGPERKCFPISPETMFSVWRRPRLWLRWPRASDAAAIHRYCSRGRSPNTPRASPIPIPRARAERFIFAAREGNATGPRSDAGDDADPGQARTDRRDQPRGAAGAAYARLCAGARSLGQGLWRARRSRRWSTPASP